MAFDTRLDLEDIGARLRRLVDAELIKCGQDWAFLCSPKQKFGKASQSRTAIPRTLVCPAKYRCAMLLGLSIA